MNTKVMFSMGKDTWETPDDLFIRLHEEFDFVRDVCAVKENAKLPEYYGPDREKPEERDALADGIVWGRPGEAVWMNPPYSRELQPAFVAEAWRQASRGVIVVGLLPSRTDTQLWSTFIWDPFIHQPYASVQLRFLKGRLRFKGAPASAPFPSAVIVWGKR